MKSKLVGSAAAILYSTYYVLTASSWHFIDSVDLLIHEAGHVLFIPFGEFLHVLMGSGFQILFPFVFVVYFYRNKDLYSASFVLSWVGINVINVSQYAGDAQHMQLPLLGNGEHDWNWILSTLHLLPYTDTISFYMFSVGLAVLCLAGYGSLKNIQQPSNNTIL